MRKLLVLAIALLVALPLMPATAQDDAVVARLQDYGANLPQGYGIISVDDLAVKLAEEDVFLLDVRQPEEYEAGHLAGSVLVPLRTLGQNLDVLPSVDAQIVVICAAGYRAMIGGATLQFLGYEDVRILKGGYNAWTGEDYPVVTEATEAETFALPDFDAELFAAADAFLTNLPQGWGGVSAADLSVELVEDPPILLDVRSADEWNNGYIEGAQHLWINEFMGNMDQWPADKDANIVVYCASAYRGNVAYVMLNLMGYTNVRNLKGGINAWIAADLPLEGVPEEAPAEVDVVLDVVLPRLQEYGTNLPDHYGTIGLEDFVAQLAEENVTVLDVREVSEIEEVGIIEGAVHIPMRSMGDNLDLLPDLDANIVVVCKSGFRATIAMTALHVLGYENAHVLKGGINAWIGEDLPVVYEAAMVEAGGVPVGIDPLLLEYVADYMANLPEGWGVVTAQGLFEEMFETAPDYLIDVRSEGEWNAGFIEGAEWLWIDDFMASMDQWPAELDANIVVYCGSGYRGNVVRVMMNLMGYTNVRNLAGGINAWLAAELPVVVPEAVS